MKQLLASTAALVLSLAGCAAPIGMHPVGQPMVNDDGHSWSRLVSGGDAADPLGCNQSTGLGIEHTHYVMSGGQWTWTTDPVELRMNVAPALGCTLAPAAIQAAGNLGAGALIRGGEVVGSEIGAYGNYAAAGETAKGLEAIKPTQIGISNVNAASSSAYAGQTQSQSLSVPSSITIHQSSLP